VIKLWFRNQKTAKWLGIIVSQMAFRQLAIMGSEHTILLELKDSVIEAWLSTQLEVEVIKLDTQSYIV
jgi:hypothetical protein